MVTTAHKRISALLEGFTAETAESAEMTKGMCLAQNASGLGVLGDLGGANASLQLALEMGSAAFVYSFPHSLTETTRGHYA